MYTESKTHKTHRGLTFQQWAQRIEQALEPQGLDRDMLPDVDYYGWWEQGVSPERAAKRALRNARNS